MTTTTDAEIVRELRESITRVWDTARRLGLMRLDVSVRKRLRQLAAESHSPRQKVQPKRKR